MIVFNCVCIFVFRRQDKRLTRHSAHLAQHVEEQLRYLQEHGQLETSHKNYLSINLRRAGNLLAFDSAMERIYDRDPESAEKYLQQIYPVFVYLMMEYINKDDTLVTFYLYILRKYKVLYRRPIGPIHDIVVALIREPSIYCRENALHAVYSCGDANSVVLSLQQLDKSGHYHNTKLITDGMLTFSGDVQKLSQALWENFSTFSTQMQVTILNYFRFQSGNHKEQMLSLLTDPEQDDEIRYSCIRYFGKYADPRAYPVLMELADLSLSSHWEYSAIASSALALYPGADTMQLLKRNLHSRHWHIRFNAAKSLEQLGIKYADMADIVDGSDRYAREMLQYHIDMRREREASVL